MANTFATAALRAAYVIDPIYEANTGKLWKQLDSGMVYTPIRGGAGSENWAEVFNPMLGGAATALSDAATIATDCALGSIFTVTLGGNRTLGNPTNGVIGRRYTWILTQDGSGSRTITLGSAFRVAGGNCALTATAAAVDVLTAVCRDGTVFDVDTKNLAVAADS